MRCHLKMFCLMAATASMCYVVTSVTWLQLLLLMLGACAVACILFLLSDSERAHALFKRPRSPRSNWDDVTRVYGIDYTDSSMKMNPEHTCGQPPEVVYPQSRPLPSHIPARIPAVPPSLSPNQTRPLVSSAQERRDAAAFRMREWAKTR